MSEGQSQAEKIPAEIIATMRRQAGDSERIRVSLGRIIELASRRLRFGRKLDKMVTSRTLESFPAV